MKQKGKDILEIGLTVRGFDKKRFFDRMADGSRQHREYSIDEWADWCDNNREEYERILSSAKLVVEKRLKEASASAYTKDVDDMIDAEMRRCGDAEMRRCGDAEMRRQKTDFVMTSMKKSIRTYTYKPLDKAEANMNVVAEGKLGLGVYKTGDKEWLGRIE